MNTKFDMEKLHELCKPVSDYLRDNFGPYISIEVSDSHIKLISEEASIPADIKND